MIIQFSISAASSGWKLLIPSFGHVYPINIGTAFSVYFAVYSTDPQASNVIGELCSHKQKTLLNNRVDILKNTTKTKVVFFPLSVFF